MTNTARPARNNPMASTWTKAALIRRAFKAGRQRQTSLIYEMERAVIECRIVSLEVRKAMVDAGLPTSGDDLRVALVCMGSENVYLLTIPRGLAGLPDVYARAAELEEKESALPLGAAIWQLDREAGTEEVWIQQWRIDSPVVMDTARKAFAASHGEETQARF